MPWPTTSRSRISRHLLRRQAEELKERAVDVMAALVAIDVRHRRGHAVHDRAQLALARGQRVLRLLQVGDVVADDVLALDRPVEVQVRARSARESSARARWRR